MQTTEDHVLHWQHTHPPAFETWEHFAAQLPTIGEHWVETCAEAGNPEVIADTLGTNVRAKEALTATILLSRRIKRLSPEQNIGLMLPSSAASLLGNLAVALLGKTAVNLNFTSGTESLLSSIEQAEVRTVYTSKRFLERLQARGLDLTPLQQRVQMVAMEELNAGMKLPEKILTLLCCKLLPASWLKRCFVKPHRNTDTAVILFSSGSEGKPKGVLLTHRNLVTNIKQVSSILAFLEDDVILSNLPPFHAFGLTVTQYLPALEQVKVVCHADPLDVAGAAEAIAAHRVTTVFGPCSIYRLFVRNPKVSAEQLQSLRLCIAGAEKLQEEIRLEFRLKFGKDIHEGYGATETAPVASVNLPERIGPDGSLLPERWKTESVGHALPGTDFRIVDPDTFAQLSTGEAGMILISGEQVMPGYLHDDNKTRAVIRMIDGKRWYVSGDKGYLDKDGYLFVIDRYARFAKIGGEMVGYGAVETALRVAIADDTCEVVVTSVPDARKGEQLVVLATKPLDAGVMREKLLAGGLQPLSLPAHYVCVDALPRLGSGKLDFTAVTRLAKARITTD